MKSVKIVGALLIALFSVSAFADFDAHRDRHEGRGGRPGFGFEFHGPGFGFGWGRGPRWGGGHPGRGSYFECQAQNRRGYVFTAQGFDPSRVQQRAIDNCYYNGSRYCQPVGCYRIR